MILRRYNSHGYMWKSRDSWEVRLVWIEYDQDWCLFTSWSQNRFHYVTDEDTLCLAYEAKKNDDNEVDIEV